MRNPSIKILMSSLFLANMSICPASGITFNSKHISLSPPPHRPRQILLTMNQQHRDLNRSQLVHKFMAIIHRVRNTSNLRLTILSFRPLTFNDFTSIRSDVDFSSPAQETEVKQVLWGCRYGYPSIVELSECVEDSLRCGSRDGTHCDYPFNFRGMFDCHAERDLWTYGDTNEHGWRDGKFILMLIGFRGIPVIRRYR